MNQTVESFISRHTLLNKNDRVIVAVSGGPDSMALLHFLLNHPSFYEKLFVAHVEHGLRGKSSVKDMEFVEKYCEVNGIPFYCNKPNVHEIMKRKGFSTQEAARFCRYEWFENLMHELGATKLATAHHGDDQIETMLMRQVRGSISGLKGIPVKRTFGNGLIIRPLLCVDKDQILNYCHSEKVPYRIDESNVSEAYQRNRFRKYILPFLKEENSKVHETFQRQSEWFHEEEVFLEKVTKEELEKVILHRNNDKITLSIKSFFEMPLALQRRGLHILLSGLLKDGTAQLTMRHLDLIIDMMMSHKSTSLLHLPKGLRAEKVYKHCEFYCVSNGDKVKSLHKKEIKIPGITYIHSGKLEASIMDKLDMSLPKSNENIFYADLDKINLPLFVRNRKRGDIISPLGLNGTKKVKNIFIDKKVPKKEREEWPIIVDQLDEILWMPNIRRSNKALIDHETKNVLVLTYEQNKE